MSLSLSDLLNALTLVFGSGVVVSLITLLYNYLQTKRDRDFESRKQASEYYKGLYARIVFMYGYAASYLASLEEKQKGRASVFSDKSQKRVELSSDELLENYNQSYRKFENYYVRKKSEGYEIFVSARLQQLLINYWTQAKNLYDHPDLLKRIEQVTMLRQYRDKVLGQIEKLYGLKR